MATMVDRAVGGCCVIHSEKNGGWKNEGTVSRVPDPLPLPLPLSFTATAYIKSVISCSSQGYLIRFKSWIIP